MKLTESASDILLSIFESDRSTEESMSTLKRLGWVPSDDDRKTSFVHPDHRRHRLEVRHKNKGKRTAIGYYYDGYYVGNFYNPVHAHQYCQNNGNRNPLVGDRDHWINPPNPERVITPPYVSDDKPKGVAPAPSSTNNASKGAVGSGSYGGGTSANASI